MYPTIDNAELVSAAAAAAAAAPLASNPSLLSGLPVSSRHLPSSRWFSNKQRTSLDAGSLPGHHPSLLSALPLSSRYLSSYLFPNRQRSFRIEGSTAHHHHQHPNAQRPVGVNGQNAVPSRTVRWLVSSRLPRFIGQNNSHHQQNAGLNSFIPLSWNMIDGAVRNGECGLASLRTAAATGSGSCANTNTTTNGTNQAGITPVGVWCQHVVATCLARIRQPKQVVLRAPISESLSKLTKEGLQKFAQNLICQMGAKKILPAAQSILDQLLTSADNPLKDSRGAPDPTAGGAIGDIAAWCFDGAVLREKLRVTLHRFCAPKTTFYSDLTSLACNLPNETEDYNGLLRSLRSCEPRGVWELLSVIADMLRRHDNNGVPLLEILTRCILDAEEVIILFRRHIA
ncbi:unnamed protein product [Protopolystoma xenopodis]|uniref:ZSWIM8 TPR repeats domain-containing protein n=1 Tax=Protopolystoma xenopodis TaxID=117903 RepID=A0A3S5BFN4_9PLAT|nr:unnamed protein product [Protopolystoma xenopodis]